MNVVGQLRVLQAFLPALRRSRGPDRADGLVGGRSALPFLGAYAMSKFALEAMADALRRRAGAVRDARVDRRAGNDRDADLDEAAARGRGVPAEAAELYGERVEKFRRLASERSAATRCPAEEVAKAVEHALTSAKPEDAVLVGPDAKRRARVEKLPHRLRDRLLTRFLFGEGR